MSSPEPEPPWYQDGLAFECTRCGACCTGAPGYVWVNAEEIARLAEYRGETVEQFSRAFVRRVGQDSSLIEKPGGDCIFWDHQAGCTVYPATEMAAPGIVKHIYGDRFGLGEPTGQVTPRLKAIEAIFAAGGLKPRVYPKIRDDIWLKLWGNLCFNPISALTHATLDVVATDPGTRGVARGMMREAERIARRIGVHFRVDVERRIDGAASVGAHRTSMLQDLEKGRPIELDALLAVVQEMGRLVDIETPTIDTVLALTQQMGRVAGVYPVYPEEIEEDGGSDTFLP